MESVKVYGCRNTGNFTVDCDMECRPHQFPKKHVRIVVATFVLSCFFSSSVFAWQSPEQQANGNRAHFSEQTREVASPTETFRASRATDAGVDTGAKQAAPQRLIAQETALPFDSGKITSYQTDEQPDNRLAHGIVMPFGSYFIDSQIVGVVRYQADFSLEGKYEILQELSDIQKDLTQYLAIPQPRETIEVFLFETEDSYRKFLDAEFPKAPYDRRALYVKQPSEPGMVLMFYSPDVQEDLRHEMTHAFLHAAMSYVPLWLDEGLAEYFELSRENRADNSLYFKRIANKVRFGVVPPLTRLEKLVYFDQMGAGEYCDAWSWVHFMMHNSRETHEVLAGYVQLLAEYGESTPAIESYLADVVPNLKQSYLEHFRNWSSRNKVAGTQNKTTDNSETPSKPAREKSERAITRGWTESIFR